MFLAVLGHDFAYEMECLVRLFYPGEKINIVKDNSFTDSDAIITAIRAQGNDLLELYTRVSLNGFAEERFERIPSDLLWNKGELERRLGVLLFPLLCAQTGDRPAWGILTGIRPVRLCRRWMEQGMTEEQAYNRFTNDYLVLPEKARLVLDTEQAQRKILLNNSPEYYSLYIGVPFCPTRCLYCSFVSHAIDKASRLLPDYIGCLCEELRETARLAGKLGLKLQTVYMGGGTPTSLTTEQLAEILKTVRDCFDFSDLLEYTVEAGRPDTITPEKLAVLREFGVNRISINPQTMNDDVLRKIGRLHSAKQVTESFHLAREAGFSAINMDLIAGLPGDTPEGFADSLEQVLALLPENITVHALTVKRSSALREQDGAFSRNPAFLNPVLTSAREKLSAGGYAPYYLYRQKATVENLENVGFSKPGFEGIYNIYSMEETHSILAAGAGGVSKLCKKDGDVYRVSNFKYPYEYIGSFSEIIKRKSEEAYAGHY